MRCFFCKMKYIPPRPTSAWTSPRRHGSDSALPTSSSEKRTSRELCHTVVVVVLLWRSSSLLWALSCHYCVLCLLRILLTGTLQDYIDSLQTLTYKKRKYIPPIVSPWVIIIGLRQFLSSNFGARGYSSELTCQYLECGARSSDRRTVSKYDSFVCTVLLFDSIHYEWFRLHFAVRF